MTQATVKPNPDRSIAEFGGRANAISERSAAHFTPAT